MSWGKTLQGMLQAVEAAQAGGRVEYAARDRWVAYERLKAMAQGVGSFRSSSFCLGGECWVRAGDGRVDIHVVGV